MKIDQFMSDFLTGTNQKAYILLRYNSLPCGT